MKPKVRTENPFSPDDRTDRGYPADFARQERIRRAHLVVGSNVLPNGEPTENTKKGGRK